MSEQPKLGEDKQLVRRKLWRRSHLYRGVAALGVCAFVATGTWALEESAKLKQGLRGIFPAAAPDELGPDAFAKLDGNWAEWSRGAAAAVGDFYAKLETTDASAQRTALKTLQAKLDVMQRAIDDPRYRSLLGPLTMIHSRLAQRIDFAEGALDTLETDPQQVRATKLAEQAKTLPVALGELQGSLGKIQNGSLWIPYVKADVIQKALAAGPTGDALVAAVRKSKERIAGRDDLSDAKFKEFLNRPPFLKFEQALDGYLAAVDWQPPAPNEDELRAQLKALLDAADNYALSRATEDAGKARAAFAAICKVAPDGGDRLSQVLQKHIFNYNIRLIASEQLLNRLMSEARTEKGPVVDYVMGANVSGNQSTATTVTFDLIPSGNTARFDLTLNGRISSSTVGVTSEATVYTQGNHSFVAKKEVNFDGTQFVTAPATIQVYPHNTTTGVSTNMGGPLFSGIANSIASQEVEKRRGAAESIAASRVRENVLPKFNSEVDKNFAEAGPKLQKEVFSGLKETGLYPDAYTYQTTDTNLRMNSRLMAAKELGADLPATPVQVTQGATLMMHETAINNAVDRIGLAGQTLTEAQLREKLEAFFSKALNRAIKLEAQTKPAVVKPKGDEDDAGGEDKKISAIVFAETDPMRVHFDDGVLVLVIRAGFKQEGKDDIPTREITVPISFEVKGNKIAITRGTVQVVAADGEGGGFATNKVVGTKIAATLPDKEVDSKVDLKGSKATVVTNISAIRFLDGWAQISVK